MFNRLFGVVEDETTFHAWETPAKNETERKEKIKQFDSNGYDFNADVIGGQSWYFLKNSENKTVAECTTKQIHGSKIYQIDDVLVPDDEQQKGYCVILITKVFRHYYDTNRSIRVFGDANIAGKCYRKVAINLETIGATFEDNKGVITASLIYNGIEGAGKNIKHKYKKRKCKKHKCKKHKCKKRTHKTLRRNYKKTKKKKRKKNNTI